MKNLHLFLCIAFVIGVLRVEAQSLKFNEKGLFKIVQFTDLHYKTGVKESQAALQNMRSVLDTEKPDFVIFTGDLIYNAPAEKSLREVLEPVLERNLNFCVTWGNHDDEQGTSLQELQKIIESLSGNKGFTQKGLDGFSNYILPVMGRDNKPQSYLYCFDSHSYSPIKNIVKGYAWISTSQIQWYKEQSNKLIAQNGRVVPSLAFFHIPLPEFNQAASDEKCRFLGYRYEKACAPRINTGLFAEMLQQKDIMGVFVGHDHDNDYVTSLYGIVLGYGRFSGGNTEYNSLIEGNGARVIELIEGKADFRSWIRLHDGRILFEMQKSTFVKAQK